LLEHGYKIVYQPGAMVWHERRQSIRAYFRQQAGYGRAEAALIAQHPHRFAKLGGARWRGVVYDQAGRTAGLRGIVYAGVFGTAPYQFLYALPSGPVAAVTSSPPWVLVALMALLGAPWVPALAAVGALMLVPSAWTAARLAACAPIVRWPGGNRLSFAAARALVGVLAFTQPLARGLVRELGCLQQRKWPAASWRLRPPGARVRMRARKAVAELSLWQDHGCDRAAVIGAMLEELRTTRWPVRLGGEWDPWDFEVTSDRWWTVRVLTATEYHPPDGRLVRVRLLTRASRWTLAIALLSCAIVPILFALQPSWGLWAMAGTFLVWLALEHLHGAAAARILRLTLATARQLEFTVIDESRRKGHMLSGTSS
jgi:hypothetical protein